MKLLYGTTNSSKLEHMRDMLKGLGFEIIGLQDLNINLDVLESGSNPLENARIKAQTYYKASGIPTFSCDSGLYIFGLEEEKQPGVHVRRVGDQYLNDEEFIEYYSKLALQLGGEVKAKFQNAISLIIDENTIYEHDLDDIADYFLLTAKPYLKRKPGFPMDSIAKDMETGKYFVESYDHTNEENITKGFRDFFERSLMKR